MNAVGGFRGSVRLPARYISEMSASAFSKLLTAPPPRNSKTSRKAPAKHRISHSRFEPDDCCHQHRTPARQGQFPNVLHRRPQTVGSQSLEGRDGNASLSICVNAELANES